MTAAAGAPASVHRRLAPVIVNEGLQPGKITGLFVPSTRTRAAYSGFPADCAAKQRTPAVLPPGFYSQGQPACKPGSVGRISPRGSHSSADALARVLMQPTRAAAWKPVAARKPLAAPIWSCSWRGLPCPFCCQTGGALLPHRFTLARKRTSRRFVFCGTFPGVAPGGR